MNVSVNFVVQWLLSVDVSVTLVVQWLLSCECISDLGSPIVIVMWMYQ